MAFNFAAFLARIDPLQTYSFEPLTGGLVILTQRVTKTARLASSDTGTDSGSRGAFPTHSSLILKYAPPFIAAIGETAPFSQDRQVRWLVAAVLFGLCCTAYAPGEGDLDSFADLGY